MSVSSVMWNSTLIFCFMWMVVHCDRVCFSARVNGGGVGRVHLWLVGLCEGNEDSIWKYGLGVV